MRREIVHAGSGQLRYMIREIVEFARHVQELGREIVWENIGDPVRKGEAPPQWMKDVVRELAAEDLAYAYSDTPGEMETRRFLAARANERLAGITGPTVDTDDIVFFNGLGDAVNKVYGLLRPQARIIGPSPAYSTHSSAEAAHSGYEHLTYRLDPERGWLPDLEEIERTVRYNPSIAGILIINPDNPTGVVYPPEILEGFVEIARRYDLFLICDETYAHIVYGGATETHLNQVIGDVPGMAMRSISKEVPWPGARCGWIEVYNRTSDPQFATYIESIVASKRLEVCSTTLPQQAIPRIMGDQRYEDYLAARNAQYEARAREASEAFAGTSGVRLHTPQGGFFATAAFDELPPDGEIPIDDPAIRHLVEEKVADADPDARFVYYLLGATGICVVPLSGFCCDVPGFRMTLLENDDATRRWTFNRIAAAVAEYRRSSGATAQAVSDQEIATSGVAG